MHSEGQELNLLARREPVSLPVNCPESMATFSLAADPGHAKMLDQGRERVSMKVGHGAARAKH